MQREDFDDGWTCEDAEPAQIATTVQPMRSRTIIARNASPDVGFDRSINPYRGCSHGWIKGGAYTLGYEARRTR